MAGGRMAEVEEAPPAASQASAQAETPSAESPGEAKGGEQKSGGLFKKFFSS